jgi:hypothetical protein
VLEGQLDLLVDQPRPARVLFADVVRQEPENAEVWRLIAGAARGVDPALRARAVARLAVLDPRGPRP